MGGGTQARGRELLREMANHASVHAGRTKGRLSFRIKTGRPLVSARELYFLFQEQEFFKIT